MFTDDMNGAQVAAELEISTKSANAWRRAWAAGGEHALASKGAPGPDPALSPELVRKLVAKLEQGPAAAGWVDDQRWTLARVQTLIGGMFHRTLAICTVAEVLHRAGYSPQQPIVRAAERDEPAIEHWRRYQWPAVKGSRAGWARGFASPTSLDCR